MMKFKNIVEGMGIGLIFDGAVHLIGKGSAAAKKQIVNRNVSIENQTTTAALAQIRKGEAEFRAAKNAPLLKGIKVLIYLKLYPEKLTSNSDVHVQIGDLKMDLQALLQLA